jgi:formylglycine-generating enzyme required for sulfatase activity
MKNRPIWSAFLFIALSSLTFSAGLADIALAFTSFVDRVHVLSLVALDGSMYALAAAGDIEQVKALTAQRLEIDGLKPGPDKDRKLQEHFTQVSAKTEAALTEKRVISEEHRSRAQAFLTRARRNAQIARLGDLLLLTQIPGLVDQVKNGLSGPINPLKEAKYLKTIKYGVTRLAELPQIIQLQIDSLGKISDGCRALAEANQIILPEVTDLKAEDSPEPFDEAAFEAELARTETVAPVSSESAPAAVTPVQTATPTPATPAAPPEKKATNSAIEMLRIPGGTFRMGSNSAEASPDEKPIHTVSLRPFFMSRTEVTQGQWKAVMGDNPAHFQLSNDHPVEQVSWDDVQSFIIKLNQASGRHYRLPSEAEWEYACRGGIDTDRYEKLDDIAWHEGNSGRTTRAVGEKQPNPYGLFDTLGNVWEWVADGDGPYAAGPQTNPAGFPNTLVRLRRGGSWLHGPNSCRASAREARTPGYRDSRLGFRLAEDAADGQ